MTRYNIYIIYITIVSISLLYAPQPLQPLLASYFDVSSHKSSLIVAITLLPLAIAPIVYGYFLENIDSKKILTYSIILVCIFQAFQVVTENFYIFLFLRLAQSLFIPAIQTSLLTILAKKSLQNDRASMQKNISIYITASIAGGLFGRIASGYIAEFSNWHTSFFIFLLLNMLSYIFARLLFKDSKDSLLQDKSRVRFKDIYFIFKDSRIVFILISVFIMFFSFQAVLTILPFLSKDIFADIKEGSIATLYLGYFLGMIISFFSYKISFLFGRKAYAIAFGFGIFIVGVLLINTHSFGVLFIGMMFVCAGGFIIHSILSASVNFIVSTNSGFANGIYLAFYYFGGFLGSLIPTYYYEEPGYLAVSFALSFMLFICGVIFILSAKSYEFKEIN